MKTLLHLIALFAILTVCTIACSKDSGNTPASQRIIGIWKLDKSIYNEHVSGVDYRDTTVGTSDDKIDFRSDGNVYTYVQGTYDTSAYSVTSETKVTIDGVPYDMQTLTDNALTLYDKENSGDDYTEETDYLVR